MTGSSDDDAVAVAPGPARRGPYAKSAARRALILEAAYAVFAARGYTAGSLRDVATEAGMSVSNLLHHFPAKEDLLLAVLERRDRSGADDEIGMSDAPLVERVVARARRNVEVPGLIELYAAISGEAATVGHPAREYVASRFARLRDDYAAEFEALAARGMLRDGVDPRVAAGSFVALWDGIQLQWLLAPGSVDVAEHLRAHLAGLLVEG